MKNLIFTIIFYIICIPLTYILNKKFPGAHDGGPGWGALFLLLLLVVIFVLLLLNLYWGLKWGKSYFLIVLVHAAVLLFAYFRFFR
jgi:hypothetical protein